MLGPRSVYISLLFSSQTIYWTDVVLGRIRRSFLNGSGVTTIISSGLESPGQCAFSSDIKKKMMYYRQVNVNGLCNPFFTAFCNWLFYLLEGIAVDWINKMLYWTDARSKKVEVFDLHGGHRKLLITTGEDTIPRTIIVDPTTRLDSRIRDAPYSG